MLTVLRLLNKQAQSNKYEINPIDLKTFEFVNIHSSSNEATTIPSVFPVPMSIEESDDGYMIDITIYTEQKNLKIDSVTSNNKVICEDVEYDVDAAVYPYIKLIVKPSNQCVVVLDKYGEIIYMTALNESKQVGYLQKIAMLGSSFDMTFAVKLYMKDNGFHIYKLAKKVRIDGDVYSAEKPEALLGAFPGETQVNGDSIKIERQVIQFSLNSNDEINYIDTYNIGKNEDPKTTLVRRADGSKELIYNQYHKRFGLVDLYDANTAFFVVPDVNSDGEIYLDGKMLSDTDDLYATSASLITDEYYKVACYYEGEDKATAIALILITEPTKVNYQVMMFDSISNGLNDEGESCQQINAYYQGNNVSYIIGDNCLSDAKSLKIGDLFYIDTNYKGNTAMHIYKMYDAESETFNNNGQNAYWWYGKFNSDGGWNWRGSRYQLIKTYPYRVDGTYIQGSYELSDAREGIVNDTINSDQICFTVYDKNINRNNIYKGSIADVTTYVQGGEACSLMILNTYTVTSRQIFIYK